MKLNRLTVLFTFVSLLIAVQAQETPQRVPLAERFKQLDRNGDLKISAEEFPGQFFKQMDKDGDRFVTLEDAQAYFAARRTSQPRAKQPAPSERKPLESPTGGELQVVDAVFELCVRDVEACAKFYRDGIGMREVEPANANKDALLEWAGCYLRLRKVPGEKSAPATGNPMKQTLSQNGFRWFSLWFNNPAAISERLVKAGYPAPMKGGNVSMTPDPDGNVVEIMGVPRSASDETFTWGMAVSDENAARQFYGQVLGLAEFDPWNLPPPFSMKMYLFATGAGRVKFSAPQGQRPREADAGPDAPGLRSVTLRVADLAAAREGLTKRGAKFDGDKRLLVTDPDGNRIYIEQAPAKSANYVQTTHTLTVDGRERTFIVQAPKQPKGKLPVVFFFHGGGGRGQNMASSGFREMVATENFVAVYPSGWKNNWNDGRQAVRIAAQVENVDDVRFIRAIVDDLEKHDPLDRTRIFASGASNGGIFCHYLAVHAADLFAGIAPVIGGLAEPVAAQFKPDHPISLLVIQGDADPLVPIGGGAVANSNRGGRIIGTEEMLKKYLTHNGITGAPEEKLLPDRDPNDGTTTLVRRYPPGKDSVKVEYWLVRGGGHTMPGVQRPRSVVLEAFIGKTSWDFNALEVIWQFFKSCPPRVIQSAEISFPETADKTIEPLPPLTPAVLEGDNEKTASGEGNSPSLPPRQPILETLRARYGDIKPTPHKEEISDQRPGEPPLKKMPDGDPARDAAGRGQLFESICVPGITDLQEGMNGVAIVDLNKDGLLDIVATYSAPRGTGWRWGAAEKLRVFINEGDFHFHLHPIKLVDSKVSLDNFGRGQVPNFADFNGDGFLDLFVTRHAQMSGGKSNPNDHKLGNGLYLSDGAWDVFHDVSAKMGIQNEKAYNRQPSIGDVNRDGWLDIAVGCDNIKNAMGGFPHSHLYVFKPNGPKFEDGHFEDIGGSDLVPDFGGFYHDSTKDKAGPDINLRDLDNDGDLDLIQSYHVDVLDLAAPFSPIEYRQGVFCWKNLLKETGKLQFEKITNNGLACEARLKLSADKQSTEPVGKAPGLPYISLADVDNDGLMDVLAVGPASPGWAPRAEYVSGRFWWNKGGFRFQEATDTTGLSALNWVYREWCKFFDAPAPQARLGARIEPGDRRPYFADAVFGDFDNDGWVDLVVQDRHESPNLETRAILFMNRGDGNLEPKPTTFSGLDGMGICGEAADLNNDGLLDLLFAADPDNSGPAMSMARYESKVYWNTGLSGGKENHWLRLRFSGVKDADLIGARVELSAPGMKQYRLAHANHSYKSGGPIETHFGLGVNKQVDVKVAFSSGVVWDFPSVAADQLLELNATKARTR
jgi:poly(3-hydroxybutyrate) depolymerase/catechol-2,3-dioxygenase